MTSVADSADGMWTFTHDGNGRLTGTSAPDGSAMTFGWQSDLPIFTVWSGTHTVVRDGGAVWSGTLAGRVDAHYNNDLRLLRLAVQSGQSGTPESPRVPRVRS